MCGICPGERLLQLIALCSLVTAVVHGQAEALQNEDCLTYIVSTLRIEEIHGMWGVFDSPKHVISAFREEEDAKRMVSLIRARPTRCFIGRRSQRSDRENYIVQYWKGTGAMPQSLGAEDCIQYDPKT